MHLKFEQKALIKQMSVAFEKTVQTITGIKMGGLNLIWQCVCMYIWKVEHEQ